MKPQHKKILDLLKQYLNKHPEQRFGQALYNLNINEFTNPTNPSQSGYLLRDIYNDTDDDIIKRIKS